MEFSQPAFRGAFPIVLLARVQSRNRRDLLYRQRGPRRAGRPAHRDVKDAGLTLR